MTQKLCERNLREFVQREVGVLLCSDVAKIGISTDEMDWVIQLNVPQDRDEYI